MTFFRQVTSFLILFGLAFAGCGRSLGRPNVAAESSTYANQLALAEVAGDTNGTRDASMTKASGESSAAPGAGGIGDLASIQPDVYLIKNAMVTIECDDARTATTALVSSLQSSNAYVSNLNEHVDGLGRRTVTMQVRVPADKFDQSMSTLESLGRILNKQVSTEDVTEEYVDTESRTRNLKMTEERLLDHLNRAAQLEDILRVENELTRVREQIERMEGRLRFLKNRVSFSTISVTIQESPKAEPIVPAQSFSTAREFSEAIRSLVGFLQGVWSQAIWFIVWLPIYAVPAIAVYVAYRRYRKKLNL